MKVDDRHRLPYYTKLRYHRIKVTVFYVSFIKVKIKALHLKIKALHKLTVT